MNQSQKFEIVDRKLDYLKLIIYRDKKTFLIWKEDHQPKPSVCSITDKIKSDLGLNSEFKGIINEKGIGINSSFNTKLYIDFRGEFFLRFKYEYVAELLNYLEENKINYKFTRLDIAIDYKNNELLPFKNKKSYFGKLKKTTVIIPEKYRGSLEEPTEWIQFNAKSQIIFYDKSKEIKQSKNKEKTVLYSDVYLKEQIYRCEVRLIKQDRLYITSKISESSIIDNELLKFYTKNPFNVNSVNIKKIFKINLEVGIS